MNNLNNLWRRLTTPRATGDDEARQEYMTKVILVIMNLIGLGILLGFSIAIGLGALMPDSIISTIVVDLVILGGWWLADKGYWRAASYILPLIFLLLALRTNYVTGIGTVAMLQYAIVVLLATILQGGITQWLALLLSIGAYLGLGWLHYQRLIPRVPTPEDMFALNAVSVSGMLVFIVTLQWFYTHQFRRTTAEVRTYANQLAAQQAGLEQAVADRTDELQHEVVERERLQQQVIEAQQQALKELSTPVIPVMDGIIIMPLIGAIDSLRARDVTRSLLTGITQHRAKVVILDITGVGLMDTGIVNHLNKTIQAARLKGAQTIVTGMSDAVAETIVDLGIDWSGVQTLADLQTGLMVALNDLGIKLNTH